MTTVIIAVVTAALGSAGLFGLVQFLISRRDKKKDLLGLINKKLDKLERDSCRTQLLVMLTDYTENTAEIMQLAEHYFKDLNGDWYMSVIFAEYLQKRGLAVPSWFSQK